MSETTQHWPAPTPLSAVLAEIPSGSGVSDRVADYSQEEMIRQECRERGIVPLFGQEATTTDVAVATKENINHRLAAMVFAQGATVKDCFIQLGGEFDDFGKPIPNTGLYTLQYLSTLRRAEWFQKIILEIIDQKSGDIIANRLKLEVLPSIETLIEVRDNAEEKGATRAAAANSLLDRYLGKPIQATKDVTPKETKDYEAERDKIEAEMERLRNELKNLNAATDHQPNHLSE